MCRRREKVETRCEKVEITGINYQEQEPKKEIINLKNRKENLVVKLERWWLGCGGGCV